MRAVIFDVDGTLIQSMAIDCELYISSIQAVLGTVKLRAKISDYDNVTDSGLLAQIFDDNSLASDSHLVDTIKAHFVSSLKDHIQNNGPFSIIHGASQMIDRLKLSGENSVAIATGCWRESAVLKLESSGFDTAGLPLATCDDSPSRIEIMRAALARLGHKFDSVVYFGDAEWDESACRVLGWDFVAVGPTLDGIESYDGLII